MRSALRRLVGSICALLMVLTLSAGPGFAGEEEEEECGFCLSWCPFPGNDEDVSGACHDLCDTFEYDCEPSWGRCPGQVFILCGFAQ